MIDFNEFLEGEENLFARYLEYKAHQDGVDLQEAARRSIGRLFSQVSNSPNTLIIITAFRSERPLVQNRRMNQEMANDLRGFGWGFTPVLGGFVETTTDQNGQPKQLRVHEESFFVNAAGNEGEVIPKVTSLLKKYQQEAALIKTPDSEQAALIFPNGEMSPVGRWHADPRLMATYYTRMRKGPANRQFTFEAARDDSLSARMAIDLYFRSKK